MSTFGRKTDALKAEEAANGQLEQAWPNVTHGSFQGHPCKQNLQHGVTRITSPLFPH